MSLDYVQISAESFQSMVALAIGFAVAGLCASGYRLATKQDASFSLLNAGPRASAIAAVPLLYFAAPFIIMRNTLVGRSVERRRFEFVMMATVLAGVWSLMSGTVVVMTLQALGVLQA